MTRMTTMVTTPRPVRNRAYLDRMPHFVYELYDGAGDPVYVGCTSNLPNRLSTHSGSEMWREVAEVRATLYPDRAEAESVEALTIREFQPRWNFQHTERASDAAKERWKRRKELVTRAD